MQKMYTIINFRERFRENKKTTNCPLRLLLTYFDWQSDCLGRGAINHAYWAGDSPGLVEEGRDEKEVGPGCHHLHQGGEHRGSGLQQDHHTAQVCEYVLGNQRYMVFLKILPHLGCPRLSSH